MKKRRVTDNGKNKAKRIKKGSKKRYLGRFDQVEIPPETVNNRQYLHCRA
jgi:hypothetical protein